MTCASGEVCSMGACVLSCEASLTDCSGSCRDVQIDRAHCGACGNTCSAGEVCTAGVCESSCGDKLTVCVGLVWIATTTPSIAACDNVCAFANACAYCNMGGYEQDVCDAGYVDANNDLPVAVRLCDGHRRGRPSYLRTFSTGSIQCWGKNYGQLGDGTRHRPQQPLSVRASPTPPLSRRIQPTCALLSRAAHQCWGKNYHQLGDGTRTDSRTPVP